MRGRAQVSLEFLLVTGVALMILASSTYFMFSYTRDAAERNSQQQVAQIGYRIIDEARNVYVYGSPSFLTITAALPEEIERIYTVENDTLVFELRTTQGMQTVPIFSDVPINGTSLSGQQTHVNSGSVVVHPGRTSFRVTAKDGWVEIWQTG